MRLRCSIGNGPFCYRFTDVFGAHGSCDATRGCIYILSFRIKAGQHLRIWVGTQFNAEQRQSVSELSKTETVPKGAYLCQHCPSPRHQIANMCAKSTLCYDGCCQLRGAFEVFQSYLTILSSTHRCSSSLWVLQCCL